MSHPQYSASVIIMTDVKSLEHPTLKVPYEILNKRFRIAQKHLDREVNHVTVSLGELDKLIGENSQLDREEVNQKLDLLKSQLVEMKNKGGDILGNVSDVANTIKNRSTHLKGGCLEVKYSSNKTFNAKYFPNLKDSDDVDKKIWNKTRLDRMLVEYLLRQGYYETALELADNAGVGDLTNTEVS